ncbi:MAG TPA: acyl carrier protein [Mucilaginibacter sp.]
MERNEILKKMNVIFCDVLDNEYIVLTDATTANDVEDWDSLNHIQLVVAIEKSFKIRFNSQEIQSWDTVGDMVSSISAKLN